MSWPTFLLVSGAAALTWWVTWRVATAWLNRDR